MKGNPLASLPIQNGLTSAAIGVSIQAYSAALALIAGNSSGTVTADQVTAVFASLSSTPLNATNLLSGTIPNGRFPATLPAASGVNLTALNASNLGSGTVPSARLVARLAALADNTVSIVDASNLLLALGAITVATLNVADVNFNTSVNYSNETITGSGAIVTPWDGPLTKVVTTGAATATLADGTDGNQKRIILITDGGDLVLTVTHLQGGTTITFDDAGDYVEVIFLNTKWYVLSNNGCVIA